ncbi:Rieske non-heme iron oxygenase family protein [Naegleria gruberi]|uniref:cholesterol 7-desaturase n=1 Tax=Naegleria gruberi TaxID=5762 RepID=D2V148_NAEGR|nr:Rieske non-heme iron oxygenase family protein [Naegleria gruberi]EFC49839.1 Rieske non-heme iron oxygenase family protein [Naegleria gruberi]|eukprot:XP_002682583.1 Rieske non-heme iron oxygenase family protein [Naegleria gruberi strain NEG-M]
MFSFETETLIAVSLLLNLVLLAVLIANKWYDFKTKDQKHSAESNRNASSKFRESTFIDQFPNGWFRICFSNELSKGSSKLVHYFGEDMVVFRGFDGSVGVLDAYCPHLGSNLGVEGKVIGNNIQCPFHLWEFDRDGQCVKIPNNCDKSSCQHSENCNETIPKNAHTRSWYCEEKYGMILVWFHSEKEGLPPQYPLLNPQDLDMDKFYHFGNYSYEDIRMNIQDFAENSADFQHFQPLHGQMVLPWSGPRSIFGRSIQVPFVQIIHQAEFKLSDSDPHIAYFTNKACLEIFGKKLTSTTVNARIELFGPAGIALFRFDGSFGRIYLFHTHSPKSKTNLDVGFVAYAEKKIPRLLVWYVVGNWVAQWQNDITVWENKIYKRTPSLVKGDGPVMKLRRWYKQFYSKKIDLSF